MGILILSFTFVIFVCSFGVHFLHFHCKTLCCYATISYLLLLDSIFLFTSASLITMTIGICHPEREGTYIVFFVCFSRENKSKNWELYNNFRKQICCLILEQVFKIIKIIRFYSQNYI